MKLSNKFSEIVISWKYAYAYVSIKSTDLCIPPGGPFLNLVSTRHPVVNASGAPTLVNTIEVY